MTNPMKFIKKKVTKELLRVCFIISSIIISIVLLGPPFIRGDEDRAGWFVLLMFVFYWLVWKCVGGLYHEERMRKDVRPEIARGKRSLEQMRFRCQTLRHELLMTQIAYWESELALQKNERSVIRCLKKKVDESQISGSKHLQDVLENLEREIEVHFKDSKSDFQETLCSTRGYLQPEVSKFESLQGITYSALVRRASEFLRNNPRSVGVLANPYMYRDVVGPNSFDRDVDGLQEDDFPFFEFENNGWCVGVLKESIRETQFKSATWEILISHYSDVYLNRGWDRLPRPSHVITSSRPSVSYTYPGYQLSGSIYDDFADRCGDRDSDDKCSFDHRYNKWVTEGSRRFFNGCVGTLRLPGFHDYEIDALGRVYLTGTDTQCFADGSYSLDKAVLVWNNHLGTKKSRTRRSVITRETLLREEDVGLVYFSPEMKQEFGDTGPMDPSTPYKWIPLSGDVEQGWMVFRTEDGVEVCFHAPSVAMEMFSY